MVETLVYISTIVYNLFYVLGVYLTVPFNQWEGTFEFVNPITQNTEHVEFFGSAIGDVITEFLPFFAEYNMLQLIFTLLVSAFVTILIIRIVKLFVGD